MSDNCVKIDPDVETSAEVCASGTSSGTSGIQGIIGLASVVLFVILLMVFITRIMKKKAEKLIEPNPYLPEGAEPEQVTGYRPVYGTADPLAAIIEETPAYSIKSALAPGWYITAEGTKDRYWNGEEWTEEYRPHRESISSNKVADSRLSKEEIESFLRESDSDTESDEGSNNTNQK